MVVPSERLHFWKLLLGEQQLLELLTEDDIASESARAIKEGGRKNTTPKFCATRWTARISTLRS